MDTGLLVLLVIAFLAVDGFIVMRVLKSAKLRGGNAGSSKTVRRHADPPEKRTGLEPEPGYTPGGWVEDSGGATRSD